MKARVLKKFKDKNTNEIRKPGDIITVSKKRFAEILEVGELVEAFADESEQKAN